MYKFSRDVIFEVFVMNWPSAKFSSSKFHWWTLTCMNQRAGYLVILENKIAKMLNLWHPRNLHASKICMYVYSKYWQARMQQGKHIQWVATYMQTPDLHHVIKIYTQCHKCEYIQIFKWCICTVWRKTLANSLHNYVWQNKIWWISLIHLVLRDRLSDFLMVHVHPQWCLLCKSCIAIAITLQDLWMILWAQCSELHS